LIRQGAVSKRA